MSNSGGRPPAGFGRGVNEYLNHYITLTDAKAGALLAASVAVGALLVSDKWTPATYVGQSFRAAAIGLLSGAVIAAALVVFPRLPSGRRGLIFWEDVRFHKTHDEYFAEVQGLNEAGVEREYAAQNFFVSAVVHRKMRTTQVAVWLFVGGVAAALVAALRG